MPRQPWEDSPIVGQVATASAPWLDAPIVESAQEQKQSTETLTNDDLQNIESGPDSGRAQRAKEVQQRREKLGTPDTTVPTTEFAGKQVPTEALLNAANEQGTTIEALTQLGTNKGLAAAKLSSTVPGQLATRASTATLNTVGSLITMGAELVGQGGSDLAKGLRKARADRANFQKLIERDSDLKAVVGERANKIINGVAETVPQLLTAAAGPVTLYATLSATATEQGLQKADELGLEGGERLAFGAASGAIEAGVTAIFGKVAQKALGVTTLEEAVSPGVRVAIANVLGKTGAEKKVAAVAKEIGGIFAEGGEEAVVTALQQSLASVAGDETAFDWNEVLDSALTGGAARGAVSVKVLGDSLNRATKPDKVQDTVKGAVAAESDPDTADKAAESTNRRTFESLTGLRKTTQLFRDGYQAVAKFVRESKSRIENTVTDAQNAAETPTEQSAKNAEESNQQNADTAAEPTQIEGEHTQTDPDSAETGGVSPEATAVSDATQGETTTNAGQADSVAVQESVEDEGTAAKREAVDRDREVIGLDEIPDADKSTWSAALQKADANGVSKRAIAMAANVIAEPRSLSDVETAGMVTAMAEAKNRHAELSEQLKNSSGDVTQVVNDIAQVEQEFDAMTKAMRASGTETGRALAARKLTIDKNFDLLSVVQRAEATKSEPLTQEQKDNFKDLTDELSGLEKELAKTKGDDAKAGIEFKIDKQRAKINRSMAKMRPKTFSNTAMDWFGRTVNTGRALRTSADLPPVFRQGFFFAMSRPVMSGRNAFKAAKTLFDPELAFKMTREIENRPNAALYKQSGLFIADPRSATPGKREEQYMENWFETLEETPAGKFLKPAQLLVEASERNYTTFLNLMRADAFDALVGTLGRNGSATVEQGKSLAFFVNAATGRGGFAKFDTALTESAKVFFAPRYTLSRFQVLTGAPAFNANDAATRKIIAAEYGKTVLGTTIFLGLAKAAFGDEVEIQLDPTSPDFLKMKFGDTRLDPMGGFSQTARFLARTAAGVSDTVLGTEFENSSDASFLFRFGRSKLNPVTAGAFELATGEDFVGNDITVPEILTNQVIPLSLEDIGGAIEDQGMGQGSAMWLASLWGIGLQTYEKKRGRSVSFRQKRGRPSRSRKQRGRGR